MLLRSLAVIVDAEAFGTCPRSLLSPLVSSVRRGAKEFKFACNICVTRRSRYGCNIRTTTSSLSRAGSFTLFTSPPWAVSLCLHAQSLLTWQTIALLFTSTYRLDASLAAPRRSEAAKEQCVPLGCYTMSKGGQPHTAVSTSSNSRNTSRHSTRTKH
jgi:hypothetical protein